MRGAIVLVLLLLAGNSRRYLFADGEPPKSGRELFERRCGGCHALDRDAEGPRLGGVYGRRAGAIKSFGYSDALKKAKITWTGESLDRWLTDPGVLAPGTDMAFRAENAEERRLIIEYLKQTSGK